MIDLQQFQRYIARPALKSAGLWSLAAERLVIGTCLAESGLSYLDQVESRRGDLRPGPAYGVCQMEGFTHDDIWSSWLSRKPHVAQKVRALMVPGLDGVDQLQGNLYYAVIMCRVFYLRVPAALPHEDNFEGQAEYWKQYYNTHLGKGTVEGYMRKAGAVMTLDI